MRDTISFIPFIPLTVFYQPDIKILQTERITKQQNQLSIDLNNSVIGFAVNILSPHRQTHVLHKSLWVLHQHISSVLVERIIWIWFQEKKIEP